MQAKKASTRHKRYLGNSVPRKTTTLRSSDWNDWKWQLRNRICSVEALSETFGRQISSGVVEASKKFPMAITPYYATLVRTASGNDPVYMMSVPSCLELNDPSYLVDDPLGEEADSPVDGLVHRYKDRVLLVTTSICGMFCRFCTRKRVTGQPEHCCGAAELTGWVNYLREHPEVKDVIVSGGDPFTMETEKLDEILTAIRSVETVETIRIGTRTPVVLPMRIDSKLVKMLRKHHPVWINTHFNHPNEITPEAIAACEKLADAGIPLGNQSVLLKGVNDNPEVMAELCRKLIQMRVKPYYIFAPDKVRGTAHFQTTIETGLRVMEYLQANVGGIATPLFVVDLADGNGKVPIIPNRIVSYNGDTVMLRNKRGSISEHINREEVPSQLISVHISGEEVRIPATSQTD